MTNKNLTITGMHCAGCATGINATLMAVDGIEKADINYAACGGEIVYDDSKVDLVVIEEKITGLGFGLAEDEADATKKN